MPLKKKILSVVIIFVLFICRNRITATFNRIACEVQGVITFFRNHCPGIYFWVLIGIVVSIICIMLCLILAKSLDIKNGHKNTTLDKDHPSINFVIGIFLLIILICVGVAALKYIGTIITNFINWIMHIASKLDAVIIVALITGAVSIISVVFSSIVARIIDSKKTRQEYLNRMREEPYAEFVEMIYKIQKNAENEVKYTEEMMREDLEKFSKKITLWGSRNVVNKWIEFREKGAVPDAGTDNLFVLEDIMNEMRKDLGVKKVKRGNLLGFYLVNIFDIKKARKK